MIPTAGFSIHDFIATAKFARDVYIHVQLANTAPKFFVDFKKHVLDFANGVDRIVLLLADHEREVANLGARWAKEDPVQGTLSEIVGDFDHLRRETERFLQDNKFMVAKRSTGGWTWRKMRTIAVGTSMHADLEKLRMAYMFHAAKVDIVLKPLEMNLMFKIPKIEELVKQVLTTVTSIEAIAQNLYQQGYQESPRPQSFHEGRMWGGAASGSAAMAREGSSSSGYKKPFQPIRKGTMMSEAETIVGSTYNMVGAGNSTSGVNGSRKDVAESSNLSTRQNEWTWLHEQFAEDLERSVGLEQTMVRDVLDKVVWWLEQGRVTPVEGGRANPSGFVYLCKASWLCGRLLNSPQFENLESTSLWRQYTGRVAESIHEEFGKLTDHHMTLPSMEIMRRLPSEVFKLDLNTRETDPYEDLINGRTANETQILKMALQSHVDVEREVTLFQNGDTIRVEDRTRRLQKDKERAHSPHARDDLDGCIIQLMRFKRSTTTIHPSISYRTNSGLSATGPSLNLCSGEDDLGFKFFSRKDARECLHALTGYRIYLDIRKAGKAVCYYNSRRTGRAKKDVYSRSTIQIWLEQRTPNASSGAESTSSLYEVPSTISSSSPPYRPSLTPGNHLMTNPAYNNPNSPPKGNSAFRTLSRGSIGATSFATSGSTGSTTSASTSSSQSNNHTVRLEPAVVAETPESAKLIIFAEPEGKEGLAEIVVMEIDPFIAILPDQCCNRRKPQGPNEPLCCMRVWLERVNSSSKMIRLTYFEQQDMVAGGAGVVGGGGVGGSSMGKTLLRVGNGQSASSQIRILGPGLPVNVDEWPKKASRSMKVGSLVLEFEAEGDKRNFLTAYGNMVMLTNEALIRSNNWDYRR